MFCIKGKKKRGNKRKYRKAQDTQEIKMRRIGKREDRVRMRPVGESVIPTLYKSLFLPATCSVRTTRCVRLSLGIILVVITERLRTMPCWKRIRVKMLRRATAALFILVCCFQYFFTQESGI